MNDFSRTWMTCVWCHNRIGHGMHTMWRSKSCRHAKIRIHASKTHMRMPEGSDELQRRAVLHDPTAQVWRGSDLPTRDQGITVLGCPAIGDDHHETNTKSCCRRFPTSGMCSQLGCCCCNFYLRVVRPDLVVQFARTHDASLWQCMCTILGIPVSHCNFTPCSTASLPLLLVEWDRSA